MHENGIWIKGLSPWSQTVESRTNTQCIRSDENTIVCGREHHVSQHTHTHQHSSLAHFKTTELTTSGLNIMLTEPTTYSRKNTHDPICISLTHPGGISIWIISNKNGILFSNEDLPRFHYKEQNYRKYNTWIKKIIINSRWRVRFVSTKMGFFKVPQENCTANGLRLKERIHIT